MEETQKQYKKQYDWLKGYQFVKGQSGNPGGKKKGTKSLKTFAREYLESLPDDEKVEYLASLPSEIVWKMAEGMPESKTDITTNGKDLLPDTEIVTKIDSAVKQYLNGITRNTP